MIENIEGYAHEIAEVEELVNDYIVRSDGKVIQVIHYPTEVIDKSSGMPIKTQKLIYVVQYENPLRTWQELYNQITFDVMEHEDVLKTMFRLDQPHVSEETLNELIEIYKDESLVADLCRLQNIEYKEE
ncbi:hypothetical protein [Staphylococcus sp. LKG3-3]|uniref:hypothetical protein n=1 Tax=Staphylococcus sp. LKG3-3 TaxID=3399685 RepID=UPI003D3B7016